MICKSCGAQIENGGRFCPNCGSPVEAEQNQYQQNAQNTYQQPEQNRYQQPDYQPVQPISQPMESQTFYQPKSRVAAGILGILLGALGIHNFYLGYTGKAVAQLLISVLSCGILSVASAIWGLVEGIMILTGSIAVDGHGVPLQD